MDIITDPEQAEVVRFPRTYGEVAIYLTNLLKERGEEVEAMKAGIRFAILALRRLQKCSSGPR